MASLGDVGNLGTGVSSALDWKVGAATSLAVVQDLMARVIIGGTCRTRAAMLLATSLSGTQASVAWRVIGADGPSSPVTGMGVPDNATTEGLSM